MILRRALLTRTFYSCASQHFRQIIGSFNQATLLQSSIDSRQFRRICVLMRACLRGSLHRHTSKLVEETSRHTISSLACNSLHEWRPLKRTLWTTCRKAWPTYHSHSTLPTGHWFLASPLLCLETALFFLRSTKVTVTILLSATSPM